MSASYKAVGWNAFKKRYDLVLVATIVVFLAVFVGVGLARFPKTTLEILLIKAFAVAGVVLLHTRIWRSDQEMIEVEPGSVIGFGDRAPHPLGKENDLGEVTLRGEIVDAKCYLGVMNPGNLKPHRACAINCIQGGIPPVLLVRDETGAASYFLLVGADGGAINGEILSLVAEPVAATGRLKRLGTQRILYCDPAAIVME